MSLRRGGWRWCFPRSLYLGLGAIVLAVVMLVPVSALAAQTASPSIESIGSGAGAEITINANINPEGLETSYEIGLECSPCGQGDQWAHGTLPAVHESREITLALTGLQSGRTYWFAVRAANADGETSRRGETLEIPSSPAPFPNGTSGGGIVEASYPVGGGLKEIAIREEERRAKEKEQEEQRIRELTARPASELQSTEEGPLAPRTQAEPVCVVPALRGDTLTSARRILAKAHCRLGSVSRPRHGQTGRLVITRQDVSAGRRLSARTPIDVTLGLAHRR
jgi:hypothetical protein